MKKVLFVVLVIIILFQFIQPDKNKSEGISENDISKAYIMPENVHVILQNKCYDCHSNNTHYPWYSTIQPIGWWMDYHINDGKHDLNFSEFKTYNEKKANHKLEELSDAVTNGWMPLDSYLWIHSDAKITPEETIVINEWIAAQGVPIAKPEQH